MLRDIWKKGSVSHLISDMLLLELQHQDRARGSQLSSKRLVPSKLPRVLTTSLAEKARDFSGSIAFDRTALRIAVVTGRAARFPLHWRF